MVDSYLLEVMTKEPECSGRAHCSNSVTFKILAAGSDWQMAMATGPCSSAGPSFSRSIVATP
jgi:hypothetical protein